MWNPDQVLDDGWETHSQERLEKPYDIWGEEQEEWANGNNDDKERRLRSDEDQ